MPEPEKKKSVIQKKYMLLIFILLILFSVVLFPVISRKFEEYRKKRYLEKTFEDIYKNFNVRIDSKEYNVVDYTEKRGGFLTTTSECYKIFKKDKIEYRLEGLEFDERISCEIGFNLEVFPEVEYFKKSGTDTLFYLINYYGFGPYFFNELIYDKSKGNDFEQIEKIFSKYTSYGPNFEDNLVCNFKVDGAILNVQLEENECYNGAIIEYKNNKFEKYFSVERDFNSIDWYEFKKENDILPILVFYFELDKEELEEVFEEIKPYYNKEEYIIVLVKDDDRNVIYSNKTDSKSMERVERVISKQIKLN